MPAITFLIFLILAFCQIVLSQEELNIPGVVVVGEDRSIVVLEEEMKSILPPMFLSDYTPVPKFSTFSVMPSQERDIKAAVSLLSMHCGNRNIGYGIHHERQKRPWHYAIFINGLRNFGTHKFNRFDEDRVKLLGGYVGSKFKGMLEVSRVDKDVYLPYSETEQKKNFTQAIFESNFDLQGSPDKQLTTYLDVGYLKLEGDLDNSTIASLGYAHSKDNYDFEIYGSYIDRLYGLGLEFKGIDLTKYLKITSLADLYLGFFDKKGATFWISSNFRYKNMSFFSNLGRRLEISNLGDVYINNDYTEFNPDLKIYWAVGEFRAGMRADLTDVVTVDTSLLWQTSKDFILLSSQDSNYLDKPKNSKVNYATTKLVLEYKLGPKIKQITSLEYNLFSSRKIPYQPIYIINPMFKYTDNKFLFNVSVNVVGEVYVYDKESSYKLSPYTTVNLFFSRKLTESFKICAKIENLLNEIYKKRKYYQADKRSATISIEMVM